MFPWISKYQLLTEGRKKALIAFNFKKTKQKLSFYCSFM